MVPAALKTAVPALKKAGISVGTNIIKGAIEQAVSKLPATTTVASPVDTPISDT